MTLAILPLPMYQLFCPNVSEVFLGNHGLHVKWLAISFFEGVTKRYTSSQTNVARENRPFVDVLPIQKMSIAICHGSECFFGWEFPKNGTVPRSMLMNQEVARKDMDRWVQVTWVAALPSLGQGFLWVIIAFFVFFWKFLSLFLFYLCSLKEVNTFILEGHCKCQVSVALCNSQLWFTDSCNPPVLIMRPTSTAWWVRQKESNCR